MTARSLDRRFAPVVPPRLPDHMRDAVDDLARQVAEATEEALRSMWLLTDPGHRHLLRYEPGDVRTGSGLGRDGWMLTADVDPPTVWCDLPRPEPEPDDLLIEALLPATIDAVTAAMTNMADGDPPPRSVASSLARAVLDRIVRSGLVREGLD